jgi:hypothetical protein
MPTPSNATYGEKTAAGAQQEMSEECNERNIYRFCGELAAAAAAKGLWLKCG